MKVFRLFPLLFLLIAFPALLHAGDQVPPPLINPLGNLDSYKGRVNYRKNSETDFIVGAENGGEQKRHVEGDIWYLTVPIPHEPKAAFDQLANHIVGLAGKVLSRTPKYLCGRVEGPSPGEVWWARAQLNHREYALRVARTWQVTPDHPITWKFGKNGRHQIRFTTNHPADRFQSLLVEFPAGLLEISAKNEKEFGAYQRSADFLRTLDAKKLTSFILDDIPQEEGFTHWTLRWHGESSGAAISLTLRETTGLPTFTPGQQLGALRVRGIAYGRARVEPEGRVNIHHPEFSQESMAGDLTPEGDSLFWLPAGLWRVRVSPANFPAVRQCETRLVPVSAGKTTILDMPNSLTAAFSKDAGGIELLDAQDDGDQASVTFSLLDRAARDITPSPANLTVEEGGARAEVLKIDRMKTPPSVVLLLDSSGSMKKQMRSVVMAARKFIASLPEEASVQVVDFDTRPKRLNGKNRKEIIDRLGTIRADGATALYDSVDKGLRLLAGAKRPALLLFTDGMDANWNDTGPGSKTTKEEIFQEVGKARIPVFSIGFGGKPDNNTLERLATLSGGRYYPAADPSALSQVFATIKANLGNTFQVHYQRPNQAAPADVPVVSLVVDTSGSMDMDPKRGTGVNFRIDKVKNLLHQFVQALPSRCLVQLQNFNSKSTIGQVMTDSKTAVLRALGDLDADDGTEILASVKTAFETLQPVPSDHRILVYLTDAALDVPAKEQKDFVTLLEKIRDQRIHTVWIGMGVEDKKEVFQKAAKLSGGKFVITEDAEALKSTFDEVLTQIGAPVAATGTIVHLAVNQRTPLGEVRSYSASELFPFPAPPPDKRIAVPESVRYATGPPPARYCAQDAALVSGDDVPVRDVTIRKRLPLKVQGANQAAEISVDEALFLGRLKGVDAPRGKRFLALTMQFNNILPVQDVTVYPDGSNHPAAWMSAGPETGAKVVRVRPTYLVPDLRSHLFLNLNNAAMLPISPATWLAQSPLIPPGDRGLAVKPDEPIRGTCLFLVPDEPLEQASLHFYDASYGHITLPLVGKDQQPETPLTALPTRAPVRLSDAFAMRLRAALDMDRVDTVKAADDSLFRVVEADFTSKVQALLDIDPAKRFWLRLPTAAGPFYTPLHPVTELLPFGFARPTVLAPGANNVIRLAFQIPKGMASNKGELLVEVKGEDAVLPLGQSSPPPPGSPAARLQGDGMELAVNGLTTLAAIGNDKANWIIADITLTDKADGGSTVLRDGFALYRDDYSGKAYEQRNVGEQERHKGLKGAGRNDTIIRFVLKPDPLTEKLLFGFGDETLTPDGASRRGLVLFKIPQAGAKHGWVLKSPYFSNLALKVSAKPLASPEILVRRQEIHPDVERDFTDKLAAAIRRVVRERQALATETNGRPAVARVALDSKEPPKRPVAVPPTTFSGATRFAAITDLKALRGAMAKIRWLPASDHSGRYRYAPEAVLTQGWGTETDLANLTEKVLARMGLETEEQFVSITGQGRAELAKLGGLAKVDTRMLPALAYGDRDGSHLLVLPFLKDATELRGLVEPSGEKQKPRGDSELAHLTVQLLVVPKQVDRNLQLRDMSAALAGGGSAKTVKPVTVLSQELPLADLSRDAVDLGYTLTGHDRGDLYGAVLETPEGRTAGDKTVDSGLYRVVGERLEIRLPDAKLIHYTPLKEEESVLGLFHTLGLNLPDLPPAAAAALAETARQRHGAADHPDELSTLRWYGRRLINGFLAGQSRYEEELARRLDLTTGRNSKARCLLVTMKKADAAPLVTSIDLMRVENEIHRGPQKASHAFNIFDGLFASELEAGILPPGDQVGLSTVWRKLPADAQLAWISPQNRREALAFLSKNGCPDSIVARVKESRKMILFPSRPAQLNGRARWCWLEVDPTDYRTIAMLDNGEHGAMVEATMGNWVSDSAKFLVGAYIGIDASLWSVSDFSLILEDHEEIMKRAQELAAGIADNFGVSDGAVGMSIGSLPIPDFTVGHVTFGFGNGKMQATPDMLGFANGYKAGVALYFALAK